MKFRNVAYILLFILIAFSTNAQEVLVNLSSYPIPKINTKKSSSKAKSVLALPFFDDFARPTVIPTDELWENSNVLTNLNYAINAPTIGVATFDAINSKGELYSTLTTTPQEADTLTSLPIDLNLTADDSVYLSFCFQPKGLGYAPTSRDSLVLEFWDNLQSQWTRVWSASVYFKDSTLTQKNILTSKSKVIHSGSIDKSFSNAILNISDSRFLTSNFKFRFINYASLSSDSQVPGLKGNSDHWHIDMVYLNKDRTFEDTIYDDVAFYKPIYNMMRNYISVPWSHFSKAFKPEFGDTLKLTIDYHNLGPYTTRNVGQFFIIENLTNSQTKDIECGNINLNAYQDTVYTRLFDYTFNSSWLDSAKYKIKAYLSTDISEDTKHLRYNDTITKTIEYYNYYALDDGSAEGGYGLYGDGSDNGMVASKFINYKEDTLRGVMMYFNRTYEDANQITFKLTVWDDDNGKPGDIIYQRNSVRPLFTDSLNTFTVYRIDPTFIPEGTFYVGWVQTSQDMLNVGFDVNTNNQKRVFNNIYGDWVNTKFEGSIMIRPIFGNMYQTVTNITNPSSESKLKVFPNPASDYITISTSDNTTVTSVQIVNMTGTVVLNQTGSNLESINIQNLPKGLYIVKVSPKTGKYITSKLLIVR